MEKIRSWNCNYTCIGPQQVSTSEIMSLLIHFVFEQNEKAENNKSAKNVTSLKVFSYCQLCSFFHPIILWLSCECEDTVVFMNVYFSAQWYIFMAFFYSTFEANDARNFYWGVKFFVAKICYNMNKYELISNKNLN